MAFQLDEAFLPAKLTAPPMTDEQFEAFCNEHPDLRFEINAQGELLVMAAASTKSSIRNSRINRLLDVWAEADGRGFAFDSSAGFVLPNSALRSPDGAWVVEVYRPGREPEILDATPSSSVVAQVACFILPI